MILSRQLRAHTSTKHRPLPTRDARSEILKMHGEYVSGQAKWPEKKFVLGTSGGYLRQRASPLWSIFDRLSRACHSPGRLNKSHPSSSFSGDKEPRDFYRYIAITGSVSVLLDVEHCTGPWSWGSVYTGCVRIRGECFNSRQEMGRNKVLMGPWFVGSFVI